MSFQEIGCQRRSDKGVSYKGGANITSNGTACVPWTKFHPKLGNHSFCANPSPRERDRVWCYTKLGETEIKEICYVPFCEDIMHSKESVIELRSAEPGASQGIISIGNFVPTQTKCS